MAGETDLAALLESMHPVLREGEYVYALWPHGRPLEGGVEAAVREAEGLTVVLHRDEADRLGLEYDFVAAWITLQVHSALEAVGLTAAVSSALGAAGISCNVLAGFHHDHLLVPVADSAHAMEILTLLQRGVVLRSGMRADREAILALTAAAFSINPVTGLPVDGEPGEVGLLKELFECEGYLPGLSIVAELGGEIVGHVISTRGFVGDLPFLGLGPISVEPHLQRRGIGSALLRETARRAAASGEAGIALLGSTDYYPRFGYVPGTTVGVQPPEPAWGAHFQVLPLPGMPDAGTSDGGLGTFRYAEPFQRL
ncbi:GNAT family N-acetyltransferase [Arthrobacter sp. SW1]|uniref:N-acetyltransferase n=1 Tax=Arthrobacter sp. SW1 TaxID=1920889 RepID=UPI000877C6E0|nr:N-acetyltransferase [Arthrobacter sp. SW1]OFI37749.1 GNAT family N-acetyltransferase [Arthrobacter sp. SW1]